MDTLNIDKNFLNVGEAHFSDGKLYRTRSERASSLALPHSSLLDFYDKEQEQCNSITLLPTTVNSIVRRHSSHYYPMLESKQQQQQQQQQQPQPQPEVQHPSGGVEKNKYGNATVVSVAIAQGAPVVMQSIITTPTTITKTTTPIITATPAASIAAPSATASSAAAAASATTIAADTPPPPIPKRTFREKYAWQANDAAAPLLHEMQTPTRGNQQQQQHQQQQQLNTAFVYPPKASGNMANGMIGLTGIGGEVGGGVGGVFFGNSLVAGQTQTQTLFVDSAECPSYLECGINNDADGISDDDRMSLENSVFDESLTSTPVKVAAYNAGKYPGAHSVSNFSAKTLAALNGDFSNVGKRSNRSSSSTVDSAIISSGYGSGRERFASNSTTADFRSRFSSVDTQSSLDSSLADKPLLPAPSNDSANMSKVTFKLERAVLNEAMRNFNNNERPHDPHPDPDVTLTETHNNYNNLNNNNTNNNSNNNNNNDKLPRPIKTTTVTGAAAAAATANTTVGIAATATAITAEAAATTAKTTTSNSSSSSSSSSSMLMMLSLPAVPARKPYATVPKLPPPMIQSQKQLCEPMESGVHASASSMSTVSAGSSTLSGSSLSSISAMSTGGAPPAAVQKRPMPPTPPIRTHNSFDGNAEAYGKQTTPTAQPPPQPLTIRNKLNRNKPPPIVYPKLHQRQDSTLSSDSFSGTSSPGYNSKCLIDAPLLQNAAHINRSGHRQEHEALGMTTTRYGQGNPIAPPPRKAFNYRQDSTISSDSFSMTSSPGYNTKIMEAPLLPAAMSAKRLCSMPAPIVCKQKLQHEPIEEMEQNLPLSPLAKCVSTPTSLQTIVRFQNGAPNTLPLQHQIINRRKSSNPYITNGRLKFRLFQIMINAFALLAIAGGLAAYFNAYPTIKFVNKTIINTVHVEDTSSFGKNPAPGTCLPIIVRFCQGPSVPYNYTVFPNYIGHFGQLETQVDLDAYEALVDVRCYELVSLFLCTLFVPKCGATGATVPPCKTLCTETMRRCGFFFDVFGLNLPEYLNCKLFKDFESPEDCVGLDQVRDVMIAAANPVCEGFQCDQNRCLPKEYVCDGHLDCMDQADEANCERCEKDEIFCGDDRCIGPKHICDGVIDCPYGQDERNCIRLSERNGDLGKGVLEVFRFNTRQWTPACVKNWDRAVSPSAVCSMLGYNSVNATSVVTQRTHRPLLASVNVSTDIWKMYAKKHSTIMQEFSNCKPTEDYPIAELTCSNYQCGKVKRGRHKPSRRIIGGSQVNPGTWPFLAAILGGPEKIFYCAGVLISDQWVLTASHCIGNHTVIDLEDWTIQLGVTRRNSFTYTGQKVKVKTVIPHPQYNTAIAHDNDIALFQLATRVAFHDHLLPVCLPPPNVKTLLPNQMCTVIGWGKREDKDPKSTYEYIVNEVRVPIIRHQQCDEWLDNLTVSDGMVCAGFEEGGRDACQGDSGGPLLCPYPGQKDRWFVGGIVSWGIMCAHPKLPGVYANVLKYIPWIHEQMQKHSKPVGEERILKYDVHPGGPDILSNMATSPIRHKKPYFHQNRSPIDIDLYDGMDKT